MGSTGKKTYDSPPTTTDQQVEILLKRGMRIDNLEEASSFLAQVNYYRFSGYALHFEKFKNGERTHKFKDGTCFSDVVYIYNFDSELRRVIFHAVESIEVAFRTQLCYRLSNKTGDSHWHIEGKHFKSFDHKRFIAACKKEAERSREGFIQSYRDKYKSPELPASWMLIEIISLGTCSTVFASLSDKDEKKKVARYFGLGPKIFQFWIRSITIIRNLCAHHARLWNRSVLIKPELTAKMKKHYTESGINSSRIVLVLDIISELLRPLGKYKSFIYTLNDLFKKYPDIPIESMGLKQNNFGLKNGVRPASE